MRNFGVNKYMLEEWKKDLRCEFTSDVTHAATQKLQSVFQSLDLHFLGKMFFADMIWGILSSYL